MKRFFEDYKVLEGRHADVGAELTRDQALAVILDCVKRYRDQH